MDKWPHCGGMMMRTVVGLPQTTRGFGKFFFTTDIFCPLDYVTVTVRFPRFHHPKDEPELIGGG
jgi:hypothetical protein